MKAFTELYTRLDETNKTNDKVDAIVDYFARAQPVDAAWAMYFLMGRKLGAIVQMPKLVSWAIESAQLPSWLFAESYDAVGDLAETIALLLPPPRLRQDVPLNRWVERLQDLRRQPEDEQKRRMTQYWDELGERSRFVLNKLITGAFRVGVSQQLILRALSRHSKVDATTLAHRLMGTWEPTASFFESLLHEDTQDADLSRPYPFCLAYPLEHPEELGPIQDWQIEWKWDGIRSQVIKREGEIYIWSRGEELISDRYPELTQAARFLPDGCVIDGEILPWKDGKVLPFASLQKRIGRKVVSQKILDEIPVSLLAFDLLELDGKDLRQLPLQERRTLLEKVLKNIPASERIIAEPESGVKQLQLSLFPALNMVPVSSGAVREAAIKASPMVSALSWDELHQSRQQSRSNNVEGVMLKRLSSPYKVGRQRGDWWKWKITPFTIDAVLILAQPGTGKRANLYTDYTFGVWDKEELVPIAKAYSGLTDDEINQVDRFVRQNTTEKFGPVRAVHPKLVFELAFEGIQRSTRHKCGIAVRFPRILRWRTDKTPEQAETLSQIEAMLPE